MPDLSCNKQVFDSLCAPYNTRGHLYDSLSEPIKLRTMPVGKYKGTLMQEVPVHYLPVEWILRAVRDSGAMFDEGLLHTVTVEMTRRKLNQNS